MMLRPPIAWVTMPRPSSKMHERIQHVLQGRLGQGGPEGKTLQGGLQGLGHAVVSQEAHALDLEKKEGKKERQAFSVPTPHRPSLPSTPCTPDLPWAVVVGAPPSHPTPREDGIEGLASQWLNGIPSPLTCRKKPCRAWSVEAGRVERSVEAVPCRI